MGVKVIAAVEGNERAFKGDQCGIDLIEGEYVFFKRFFKEFRLYRVALKCC